MTECIIGSKFLHHPCCSPLKALASKSPGTIFFYTLKTSLLPWEHLAGDDRPGLDTLPHIPPAQPTHQLANLEDVLSLQLNFLLSLSNPAVLLFSNGKSRNHFRKEASWFISLIKLKKRDLSTVHMMNGVPSPWPQ